MYGTPVQIYPDWYSSSEKQPYRPTDASWNTNVPSTKKQSHNLEVQNTATSWIELQPNIPFYGFYSTSRKQNYLSQRDIVRTSVKNDRFLLELHKLQYCGPVYATPLSDRILYLAYPPEEDKDEDWPEVNLDSFITLVDFFINRNNVLVPNKKPSISLTYDGTLRAEWREAKDQFLGVEFLAERIYKYVIFSPSKDLPNQVNRESGVCGRTRLEELVSSFNWLKQ